MKPLSSCAFLVLMWTSVACEHDQQHARAEAPVAAPGAPLKAAPPKVAAPATAPWKWIVSNKHNLSNASWYQGAGRWIRFVGKAPGGRLAIIDEADNKEIDAIDLGALEATNRGIERAFFYGQQIGGTGGMLVMARFVGASRRIELLGVLPASKKIVWRTPVELPIVTSALAGRPALTEVQLRSSYPSARPPDEIEMYARSRGQVVVGKLDTAQGKVSGLRRITAPMADTPWSWPGPKEDTFPGDAEPIRYSHKGHRYTLSAARVVEGDHLKGHNMVLTRHDGEREVFRRAFMSSGFGAHATMLEHDTTLYLALHHPIATGCEILAVDARTGKTRWQTPLVGAGPVGHSKYRNRVGLSANATHLIVHGWESYGRYIEILDHKRGQMSVNLLWR